MRILAVADTHVESFDELPERLIRIMEDVDMVVHAGDYTSIDVLDRFIESCTFKGVYGNADDAQIKERLKSVEKLRVERIDVGILHSGNYVNQFHDLGYKAKELGVNLLIFGHIHRFVVERFGDVVVVCPGSPTLPRLSASSCAVIEIENRSVKINFELVKDFACGMDVNSRSWW